MRFDSTTAKFKISHGTEVQASEWRKVLRSSPQQSGDDGSCGVDCGVFLMMAMKRVYADRELDYNQIQVRKLFRAMCTLECASLQLFDMMSSFPEPCDRID